ncbi:MAG TPA: glycosyltransferase family 4 protein [Anaerolineae bacterium]|nr:glycosyltransferase family 4 protein [Anaerolineae bacterium]
MAGLDTRSRRRVLFLCKDVIGRSMAGPGIRYWEFARVLSHAGFDVTLAVLPFIADPVLPEPMPFPARVYRCRSAADVRALARESDVVVAHGILLATYPFLPHLGRPLVLDLYIPFILERLHVDVADRSTAGLALFESYLRAQALQTRWADFSLCASEKQRDYYLGVMSALGRVNPFTHADDPTLRRLIDVAPIGLPADPPRHTRQVLKGVHPGIAADDKVLLWLSGIWNWFDAPTLIRALARIVERRTDVKLFFMGVKHPDPRAPEMQATLEALALSRELGLHERYVFFNDWVPYEERANYLLEADVAISLHLDHLETRFSFRVRFLDYFWAGLPIVATRGDVLSEQVEAHQLGRVVEVGDVDGLVEAIGSLLATSNLRETYRPRFEPVAQAYRWEVAAQPLLAFCQSPRVAPDKAYLRGVATFALGPTPWWRLPGQAWRALRVGGLRGLARRLNEYRRWLLARRGRGVR